jgi:hypothetical protein
MAAGFTVCALISVAWAEPVSGYCGDKPTPFDVAVERGMSRGLARQMAGEPDARFGADIWIYMNCRLTKDATPRSDNDTLCIGFERDRVVILKLVPLRAIRELAATRKLEVISSRLKVLLRER